MEEIKSELIKYKKEIEASDSLKNIKHVFRTNNGSD